MIVNPNKIKCECPYCGKSLFFRTKEEKLAWNITDNNGQVDLKNWYFYCGCADGKKWTWCIDKVSGKWKYHDWDREEWKNENPNSVAEKVQFT